VFYTRRQFRNMFRHTPCANIKESVVIITLPNGPLYSKWMNSRLCTRTHSKIPVETHKIFETLVLKQEKNDILSGTSLLWMVAL